MGFAGDLAMTAPPFADAASRRLHGAWAKGRFVVAGTLAVSVLVSVFLWFRGCSP